MVPVRGGWGGGGPCVKIIDVLPQGDSFFS